MMYLLYRIGRFLAVVLPLKISYGLADFLASLYFLLAKRDKKIVANNMKVILSGNVDSKNSQINRLVFINFARYLVEFLHSSKIDLRFIEKRIKIEGRENLDRVLSLGRGALLVSAHLGNWELGAVVLSLLGYKINIVAWTHKNKQINDFFLYQRHKKGVRVIPLGVGIRKVFSVLKNNEIVALLADIDYLHPNTGIAVKFFGQDTIMPKGPALFSLKAHAPIVPVFLLREDYMFRLVLEKPIIHQAKDICESDLTRVTQTLTKIMENFIARYPGQWFMLTPRWKER